MASPTAIPNAEKSAHHRRHPQQTHSPPDFASEIRTSEGNRLSFSPPVSFYSRSSAGGPASLRLPAGMSSAVGTVSPSNRFSMGFSPTSQGSQTDDSRMPAPACHTRARSQTAIAAGTVPRGVESWDDKRAETRPPTFTDAASSVGSQSSSYFSTADLAFSHSPTSPGTSASSVGTGYSLGRVPSLPLGASYEQAQKRFNSGSWGQKMGWMNTMRSGPLSPPLQRSSIDEGSAVDGAPSGAMGNLLRRFSLSGNSYRSANGMTPVAPSPAPITTERHNLGSSTSSAAASIPRSASPKAIPITRDSGVSFNDGMPIEKPVARGRQPSFGSSAKRKPSPMGERLLMGHFNAH